MAKSKKTSEREKLERMVLQAVMLYPDNSQAMKFWKLLDRDNFTSAVNRQIYTAMAEARENGERTDYTNTYKYLKNPEYIEHITVEREIIPSEVDEAINTLRLMKYRDRVMELSRWLANSEQKPIAELQSYWDNILDNLAEAKNVYNGRYFVSVQGQKAMIDTLEKIKEMKRSGTIFATKITGLEIDKYISEFVAGEFWLLAARTSHGKSALSLQVADNYLQKGEPVLIITLEMSYEQVITRLLSRRLGIEHYRLMDGAVRDEEIEKIQDAIGQYKDKLIIYDNPKATIIDIANEIQDFKIRYPEGELVIVDYVQLIKSTDKHRWRNRYDELGKITASLRQYARQYNVMVFGLAQLSREGESGHPPRMKYLRESGNLEQDADKVILLWRPAVEHINKVEYGGREFSGDEIDNLVVLELAKNRQGKCGVCFGRWFGDYMRVERYDKDVDNEQENKEIELPI